MISNFFKWLGAKGINKYAIYFLFFLLAIAVLAPFIANDKPYYMRLDNQSFFPLFTFKKSYTLSTGNLLIDATDWKKLATQSIWFAPIPYSANTSDMLNANFVSPYGEQSFDNGQQIISNMPWRFYHWLGTNKRGQDVLSGLIYGTQISLAVGIGVMLLATLIGVCLGALAGYFGNNLLPTCLGALLLLPFQVGLIWYYAWFLPSHFLFSGQSSSLSLLWTVVLGSIISLLMIILFYLLNKFIVTKIPILNKKMFFPLDSIISRLIEVIISLPILIVIITIAAITRPSIINLILIMAAVQWTTIARLVRAEMLKVKQLDYVHAAQVLGLSHLKIIWRHALPNSMASSIVAISFGIAGTVLTESGLSFLGIGVPPETVTWGLLINSGRENFEAWWLILFPGMLLFFTVLAYNILGESLRAHYAPKR
jgi:peptide/nickel transport system permease protein